MNSHHLQPQVTIGEVKPFVPVDHGGPFDSSKNML